jgi:protocatechuate 3,4-dioxygenase beta subunit
MVMKVQAFILLIFILVTPCLAQDIKVGGDCEGCEAIFESEVPFQNLKSVVLLPDASWNKKKPLGINGIVFKADGKSPAPGVVLYLYHTDQKGHYPKKGNEKGWAKRHGYIRGWVRTNEKGEYKFVTLRPAAYPDSTEPAHIHIIVKEPGFSAYYIDNFLFDDDPLLTDDKRAHLTNRGGSGIIKLIDAGNMFKAARNIYLGKNIPDYPLK